MGGGVWRRCLRKSWSLSFPFTWPAFFGRPTLAIHAHHPQSHPTRGPYNNGDFRSSWDDVWDYNAVQLGWELCRPICFALCMICEISNATSCAICSHTLWYMSSFKAIDLRRLSRFDGCCLSVHEWMTILSSVPYMPKAAGPNSAVHCNNLRSFYS